MPDGSGTWEKGSLKSTLNWTLGLTLVSSMPDGSGTWETGLKPILDFYLTYAKKAWCLGGGGAQNISLKSNMKEQGFTHSCWGNWPLDWPDLCYQHTLGQFPISISCSVYSESSGVKDHSFLQHTTWSFQFSTIKWNLASFLTLHNPGPSTIAEVAEPWSIHWKEMKNIFSVVDAV